MKTLFAVGITALAVLSAPVAQADPEGWCDWSPELDVNSCGLIVGVPPTGELVDEVERAWSTGEVRTKD